MGRCLAADRRSRHLRYTQSTYCVSILVDCPVTADSASYSAFGAEGQS